MKDPMKQKHWYMVLALQEVLFAKPGERIGYIPVFRTNRDAKKYAGKKFQVIKIERAA